MEDAAGESFALIMNDLSAVSTCKTFSIDPAGIAKRKTPEGLKVASDA